MFHWPRWHYRSAISDELAENEFQHERCLQLGVQRLLCVVPALMPDGKAIQVSSASCIFGVAHIRPGIIANSGDGGLDRAVQFLSAGQRVGRGAFDGASARSSSGASSDRRMDWRSGISWEIARAWRVHGKAGYARRNAAQ